MNKHKSEDYKLQAVKYYSKSNKSMDDVCEIFNCSKTFDNGISCKENKRKIQRF